MSKAKNPAENPERVIPAKGGAGIIPGNPGNSGGKKGRSGRPPNEFKDLMQAMVSGKKVEAYLRKCLAGEFGPKFFLSALTYASDRGYGKPSQAFELSGPDGKPIEVRDVSLEDMTTDELAAYAASLAGSPLGGV